MSLAKLLVPGEDIRRIEVADGDRPIVTPPPFIAPEMIRPYSCGAPNLDGKSRQLVSTDVVDSASFLQRPLFDRRPHKFYAVRRGFQPGIYYSWPDCQKQVERYPGARFKSFPTREQA
jgi:hypothetical protein